MNDALQYRNGIDFHFDWAVSQFVSKSVLIGIAGYSTSRLPATAAPARSSAISRAVRLASARR
jgi:hypothetical protein